MRISDLRPTAARFALSAHLVDCRACDPDLPLHNGGAGCSFGEMLFRLALEAHDALERVELAAKLSAESSSAAYSAVVRETEQGFEARLRGLNALLRDVMGDLPGPGPETEAPRQPPEWVSDILAADAEGSDNQ